MIKCAGMVVRSLDCHPRVLGSLAGREIFFVGLSKYSTSEFILLSEIYYMYELNSQCLFVPLCVFFTCKVTVVPEFQILAYMAVIYRCWHTDHSSMPSCMPFVIWSVYNRLDQGHCTGIWPVIMFKVNVTDTTCWISNHRLIYYYNLVQNCWDDSRSNSIALHLRKKKILKIKFKMCHGT